MPETEIEQLCRNILANAGLARFLRDDATPEDLSYVAAERLAPAQRIALRAVVALWNGRLDPDAPRVLGLV